MKAPKKILGVTGTFYRTGMITELTGSKAERTLSDLTVEELAL